MSDCHCFYETQRSGGSFFNLFNKFYKIEMMLLSYDKLILI